jgi:imidazole glycerol-phosphate synthase subunit HisH
MAGKIGIINYGAGNLFSLQCALDRVEADWQMVNTIQEFENFDKYIIPGVGHASPAMERLLKTGLVPSIQNTKKPLLGVCLGMQLLSRWSEEGETDLLNIVPLKTLKFRDTSLKIPQMGWNTVFPAKENPLFKGINEAAYFYFVHSYFVEYSENYTIAFAEYGDKFSASLQKDNFFGVQFHPEKSGLAGEQLLKNFSKF